MKIRSLLVCILCLAVVVFAAHSWTYRSTPVLSGPRAASVDIPPAGLWLRVLGQAWRRWDEFVADVRYTIREQLGRARSRNAALGSPALEIESQSVEDRAIIDQAPAVAGNSSPGTRSADAT